MATKRIELGDVFKLFCGVEVKVIGLSPIVVADMYGNSRTTYASSLRSGRVGWSDFGVPSHRNGSRSTKIGDRIALNCGVTVEVVDYKNNECVKIKDDIGNVKITSSSQLRKGTVSWRQFGIRVKTKIDRRVMVGDRKLSKRHGYYEIVEITSSANIRIVWDDYELSQICSVGQIDDNTVKPKSLSHLTSLDELKRFYVYLVISKDKGKIVYIGKGVGRRLKHANSGTSHNYHLNRLHFSNMISHIKVFADDLSEEDALTLEKDLIEKHKPPCNIMLNTSKDCNIIL